MPPMFRNTHGALHRPQHLFAEMVAGCLESPNDPVCGLLLGRNSVIRALVRLRNIAPAHLRATCLEYDLNEASRLVEQHRQQRVCDIGLFYSRVEGGPWLSDRDAARATTAPADYYHLVLAVVAGMPVGNVFVIAEGQVRQAPLVLFCAERGIFHTGCALPAFLLN